MSRIITKTEADRATFVGDAGDADATGTARALTRAATMVSKQINARYLCTFTETGLSARLVARHRPNVPILAFHPSEQTRAQAVSGVGWSRSWSIMSRTPTTWCGRWRQNFLDHERAGSVTAS